MCYTRSMEKKFKVEALEMTRAVRWASKRASSMLVLEIESNRLTVSGFNNPDLSRATCDVIQEFDGKEKFAVHHSIISNALKVLKKDTVTFTISHKDGGAGNLVAGNGRTKVSIPFTGEGTRAKLPETPDNIGTVMADEFKRAIDDVYGSADSTDNAAALILTAVNLKFYPEQKVLVATTTNRYRLTMRKIPMDFSIPDDTRAFDVNLSAHELKSLMKDVDSAGALNILYSIPSGAGVANSLFGFSSADQLALIGVMDGTYINYQKLIKKSGANAAKFDRKELLDEVNNAKLFADGTEKRLKISFDGVDLTLSCGDNYTSETTAVSVNFDDSAIDVSLDYIAPALSVCHSSQVSLEFDAPGKPLMIFELDSSGNKSTETYNMLMLLSERRS